VIIIFHALDRAQIRNIVDLQLERVKRSAHGQGVELEIDFSLVDHLATLGFRPEYGARELRRLIRSAAQQKAIFDRQGTSKPQLQRGKGRSEEAA
jgi:ATP-dependent Clp protease ATP-binding subunit ClpC